MYSKVTLNFQKLPAMLWVQNSVVVTAPREVDPT